MSLFASVKKSEPVIVFFPVGGLLDIPTSAFVNGSEGQLIMNGGLGPMTGVVGKPHMFKSTLAKSILYIAMLRVRTTLPTSCLMYDTEFTVVEEHQKEIIEFNMKHSNELRDFFVKDGACTDLINDETVVFTSKKQYKGDEYYELLKNILRAKNPEEKRSKDDSMPKALKLIETSFLERDGTTPYKILPPTFGDVDSITEFTTSSDDEMQDEHVLGNTAANPAFMKQGLNKQRFLMGLPALLANSQHYVMMTAQVGKEISMQTGPMPSAPQKQLAAMNSGDVLKGVSSKFVSLANVCWQAVKTSPCLVTHRIEDGLKYPLHETKGNKFDNDLYEVEFRNIRNKNGPTGATLTLLVSQSKGFLPDLTEFHYIKVNDFGLDGNDQNYVCTFLPEIKLSRTTIRKKLETEPMLQRAINIASEMLQIKHFKQGWWIDYGVTPKELYEGLKAQGYDWNELLKTRGWHSIDKNHPLKELSTIDLLRLFKGHYFPYWMDRETKRAKV